MTLEEIPIGIDRRRPKNMTTMDRIVWGADYPENIVAVVNVFMGLLIMNPLSASLPLAVFGRFLLTILPQEGVWGAMFLFLGIVHYVIRRRHDNRRLRRVICLVAFLMWLCIWGITVYSDWRGTGTVILFVMAVNAWVAHQRLGIRKIEGLWYAQRRD